MQELSDTIAAIATAPGEGAISIVRLSGPQSIAIADRIFLCRGQPLAQRSANTFVHGHVRGNPPAREGPAPRIDEVILLLFRAPRSYTGQDVIEIQCHGGGCSARRILRRMLDEGARVAEPGEFTRRAFLCGRIDLLQAESVLDLIRARSDASAGMAMEQLDGVLSHAVARIYDSMMSAASDLEALLDFTEDETEDIHILLMVNKLGQSVVEGNALISTWDDGRLFRDGALVGIAGRTNVGKSTLLNQLLGYERAIVTDIPGTTRDTIEESILIDGIVVRLVDTAGIRETDCPIEKNGIGRTKSVMERSDLLLYMIDGSSPLSEQDVNTLQALDRSRSIVILNKSDLGIRVRSEEIGDGFSVVRTSLLRGDGIQQIRTLLSGKLRPAQAKPVHAAISERHRMILVRAMEETRESIKVLQSHGQAGLVPAASHLRSALESIGEVTGKTYSDALLDAIFSRFCIGK